MSVGIIGLQGVLFDFQKRKLYRRITSKKGSYIF